MGRVSLTGITIGDSVTTIGESAFEGCTGLTGIAIPYGVTGIGNFAFKNCTGLTSVTIPNGVTTIGESAFELCTGLTGITIPDSVTSIGPWAFYDCTDLQIYFCGSESQWDSVEKGARWNGRVNNAVIIVNVKTAVTPAGAATVICDMAAETFTAIPNPGYVFLGWKFADEDDPDPEEYISTECVFTPDAVPAGTYTACLEALYPGSGTAAEPWRIGSQAEWNRLSSAVGSGMATDGQYFQLTDDVSVSAMIGTADNPFCGHFDGAGHTLTAALTCSSGYAAPFAYVSGASFESLKTDGTITVTGGTASGLAGAALGDCSITDCVVDVDITGSGGGGHTGFVAMCSSGNVSVTGSV